MPRAVDCAAVLNRTAPVPIWPAGAVRQRVGIYLHNKQHTFCSDSREEQNARQVDSFLGFKRFIATARHRVCTVSRFSDRCAPLARSTRPE